MGAPIRLSFQWVLERNSSGITLFFIIIYKECAYIIFRNVYVSKELVIALVVMMAEIHMRGCISAISENNISAIRLHFNILKKDWLPKYEFTKSIFFAMHKGAET